MRMRKISEKVPNLEDLVQKFLLVKQSQHTGELAMRDYQNCLADFLKHSQNSVSYDLLEDDALRYFAEIPPTSPARFNKPFQNTATPNFKNKTSSGSSSSGKIESPNKPKPEPAKADASKFRDVSGSDWYFGAVQYVLEKGLMNGTSDWTFAPNDATTRGMIVTILARVEGVNTTGNPWYAAGQKWAMQNGISDGTNMPGVITREQLATILFRYAKMKGYDVSRSAALTGFVDSDKVSSYALDAMQWAVAEGLLKGSNGKLDPQGSATRAQVATILMRFMQKYEK